MGAMEFFKKNRIGAYIGGTAGFVVAWIDSSKIDAVCDKVIDTATNVFANRQACVYDLGTFGSLGNYGNFIVYILLFAIGGAVVYSLVEKNL